MFSFSVSFEFWPMRYFWVLGMTLVSVLGTRLSRTIAEGMRLKAIADAAGVVRP